MVPPVESTVPPVQNVASPEAPAPERAGVSDVVVTREFLEEPLPGAGWQPSVPSVQEDEPTPSVQGDVSVETVPAEIPLVGESSGPEEVVETPSAEQPTSGLMGPGSANSEALANAADVMSGLPAEESATLEDSSRVDDLKSRIEETRRRIRRELEQPFDSSVTTKPLGGDWTSAPAVPEAPVAPAVEAQPVAQTPVVETPPAAPAAEAQAAQAPAAPPVAEAPIVETPPAPPVGEGPMAEPPLDVESPTLETVEVEMLPAEPVEMETLAAEPTIDVPVAEPVAGPAAVDAPAAAAAPVAEPPMVETPPAAPAAEAQAAQAPAAPPVEEVPPAPMAPAAQELVAPVAQEPAAPVPVAPEAPAAATEAPPVDLTSAVSDADATAETVMEEPVDYDSMKDRIESTRSRLKAKAFDAMMTGEAALLGRDQDGAPRSAGDVEVDRDIDETIETSLQEEGD